MHLNRYLIFVLILIFLYIFYKLVSTNKKVRIAIIGAGVSGVGVGKELSKNKNFEIDIYEKNPTVGGVWRSDFAETQLSSAYFKFNEKYDQEFVFGKNTQIISYLEKIVKKYNLNVKLNSKIEKIEYKNNKFIINNDPNSEYDFVIKTGESDRASIPKNKLSCDYIHSKHITQRSIKTISKKYNNITIVGGGKSAHDVARELTKLEKRYTWVARNLKNVYSIKSGRKILHYSNNHEQLNFMNDIIFNNEPIVSGIEKMEGDNIYLKNNKKIKSDIVIFCTGYKNTKLPKVVNSDGKVITKIPNQILKAPTTVESGIFNAMHNAEYSGKILSNKINGNYFRIFLLKSFNYHHIYNLFITIFPNKFINHYIKRTKFQDPEIKDKYTQEEGIKIFRGKLSQETIDKFQSTILNQKQMDYKKMNQYVDEMMKQYFPGHLWEKYRMSIKNSNRHDASRFHRDVISDNYNVTQNRVFTIITYLEEARFSYIPKSNGKYDNDIKKSVTIDVKPGDVIRFDSTLIHRGEYVKKKPRTCIQIFNVFKSEDEYYKVKNSIGNSVLSDNPFEKLVYKVSSSYYEDNKNSMALTNPKKNGSKYLLLMIEGGSKRTEKDVDDENKYYLNPNFKSFPTNNSNIMKIERYFSQK